METTDFSEAQQKVLTALSDTDVSVLVTGVAGCGKSTIIRHWLQHRPVADSNSTMVLAPTGIAALNVGGSTIHRAFGFQPNTDTDFPKISLKVKSLLYNVRTIVLDEVSMVRADLLHAMDVVLKSVKRSKEPFGGVRMIMVGDFYQLPPVVHEQEERWLESRHGSRAGWVFHAPCFQALNAQVFYLAHSFRQSGDTTYTSILNGVRSLDPNTVHAVNEIAKPGNTAGEAIPRLCARKKDVASHNNEGLRRIGRQIVILEPVISGDISKAPREACENVVLAEGARVMITRNGAGYVNGSLGTLTNFDATATLWNGALVPAIEVMLDKGYSVTVPREVSEVLGYEADEDGGVQKVVLCEIAQYPIALAYAWTIHKSQGQTLEAACIDLGRGAFAHGQTYVALSRLTTAAGLYLAQPLTRSDLLLDPDVPNYFGKYTV